ncbi:DnaJ C-terminal domain-containing protein [Mucisphaera sp.]|uniref:DnaJ C-terminal domain-containing protein n=1 Tax=Mucisphaera sp. TaxID=2913024 RepID=UPI003D0F3B76
MSLKFEDYYKQLGVSRTASGEEIQKAYRALARKYHPDVNKEPGASEKFSKISEAYEVLKDPAKRKKYDALGQNWKQGQAFEPPPGFEGFGRGRRAGSGQFQGGFHDFFEAFFQQQAGGSRGARGGGGFEDLFGQGGVGQSRGQAPRAQEHELEIGLYEAYAGSTRSLTLDGPSGKKTLALKIPAGTADGNKIRLKADNLILKVKVARHPDFELSGRDLTTTVRVSPWQAALGAKVGVKTLDGSLEIGIPAGTSSGQRLRVKGKGLPNAKGEAGHLYVRVMVDVPKELSDEERDAYERLRSLARGD